MSAERRRRGTVVMAWNPSKNTRLQRGVVLTFIVVAAMATQASARGFFPPSEPITDDDAGVFLPADHKILEKISEA